MSSIIFLNQSAINIGDTVCANFNFRNIRSQFAINHNSEKQYVLSNNFMIYDQIVSSSKIIDLRYTDQSFVCNIPETPTPTYTTETPTPTYTTETPIYPTETTVPTYPTETPTPTPTETPTPTPTYSCCTAGDTQYAPDATVSVTENISGCVGLNDAVIDAPDLVMTECGVFTGPCDISGDSATYTARYNGDGTWSLEVDNISDPYLSAVAIPGAGGNTSVTFPCNASDDPPVLERVSNVTITATGVCEPSTVCCTAFYVPDNYQENKDQFGNGCLEPGFMDVGDGCRYIITLDNCDECDAHAALPDSWPPGLTWECIPSSDCGPFIP